MIRDTIDQLENSVRQAPALKDDARAELLSLLARLKGEVDEVVVMFTRFINTLSQRPDSRITLPMVPVEKAEQQAADAEARAEALKGGEEKPRYDFLFEPDANTVMERLMLYLVDFRIAQLLLEAKASEQSARMVAMKSATDNVRSNW